MSPLLKPKGVAVATDITNQRLVQRRCATGQQHLVGLARTGQADVVVPHGATNRSTIAQLFPDKLTASNQTTQSGPSEPLKAVARCTQERWFAATESLNHEQLFASY